MRSLKEYLIYEYKAQKVNLRLMKADRIITNEITLKDLKDAGWGSSLLDDYSWIIVDGKEFHKIKKDGWYHSHTQGSALSGTISSEELFNLIQKNKSENGYKGEIYINEPHNVPL